MVAVVESENSCRAGRFSTNKYRNQRAAAVSGSDNGCCRITGIRNFKHTLTKTKQPNPLETASLNHPGMTPQARSPKRLLPNPGTPKSRAVTATLKKPKNT